MKKNDGYALPFVLVVMVIICLVGISIMSSSLNNLQNQQASIERMQAQYEAEGIIEKTMALAQGNNSVSVDILQSCGAVLVEDEGEFLKFTENIEDTTDKLSFVLEAVDADERVKISCKIEVVGSFSSNTSPYNTEKAEYNYISYQIIDLPDSAEGDDPNA